MTHRRLRAPSARAASDALRTALDAQSGEVVLVAEGAASAFVRFEVRPGHLAAFAPAKRDLRPSRTSHHRPAGELGALGWRKPTKACRFWHQYLYPQRGRDLRLIAAWAVRTLTDGYAAGGGLDVLTVAGRGDQGAVFASQSAEPSTHDAALLAVAQEALAAAPFRLRREPGHLELMSVRHHHRAHLGVSFSGGTVSVFALHLVEPDRTTLRGHLASNRALDGVPFVFAERSLDGGLRGLVLQTKLAVPPWAATGFAMAPILAGLLEPMIASHRQLHASPGK